MIFAEKVHFFARERVNKMASQEKFNVLIDELKQKAASGDADALTQLAYKLYMGATGNEKNMAAAFPYFKEAVDRGNTSLAAIVGEALRLGVGCSVDVDASISYYRIAVDNGDVEKARLVRAYYYSKKKDESTALHYYKIGADAGDSGCQEQYAWMCLNGCGCGKDIKSAEHYYRLASLQNNAEAQHELGLLLWERGRESSYGDYFIEACHWFACAYLNHNSDTEKMLEESGLFYDNGFQAALKGVQQYGINPGSYSYDPLTGELNSVSQDEQQNTTVQNVSTSKSGGCYIATAVYGSYDCPEVWTLRRFRDSILASKIWGRLFIKIYYQISPIMVKKFKNNSAFIKFWRTILDKLVTELQSKGIENTPYIDK